MKKSIFITVTAALLFSIGSTAQNLAPNPSFEDTVHYPHWAWGSIAPAGWHCWNASADYLNTINIPVVDVPSNLFGYQFPRTGNAYCGFVNCYAGDTSSGWPLGEVMEAQLIQPLIAGEKYFVSFYVNRAISVPAQSGAATNKIGVKFTNMFPMPIPLNNNAHVYTNSIITDSINWVNISGSFIADSAYTQMAIGNFFHGTSTSAIVYDSSQMWSYYFIDDVCVSQDSLYCATSTTTGIANPANHLLKLFPNPFARQVTVELIDNGQATITLYDILSRQVLQRTFRKSITINTEQLGNGIYIYEVRNENGILANGKIIRQ